MSSFSEENGELYCEGIPLRDLARKFGTPLYVYSKSVIQENCRQFISSFSEHSTEICYAVKANYNLTILKTIFELGLGADVVSQGEFERSLKAGVSPTKIVFSGVGKNKGEIERAVDVGIAAINVESLSELLLIKKIAEEKRKIVSINLRVNPNINVKTNPYIATGLYQTKFGIADELITEMLHHLKAHPLIQIHGLACHIGSQITELHSFEKAAVRLKELAFQLKELGYPISRVDMGGGLGISYKKDELAPSIAQYGETLLKIWRGSPFKLYLEPGRAIVGAAGGLLTEVIHCKQNRERHFTIVDAAMNDLIRPCLYEAYHDIVPVIAKKGTPLVTDIVGPVCETGDFLGLRRSLTPLETGDLLFVKTAGAYGSTMSSNYNTRVRSAEVLVSGKGVEVIRRRETLSELWQQEI